jgi:hypothetical protein
MSISKTAITVGAYYSTNNHQLRKIVEMPVDAKGVVRVRYIKKSIWLTGKSFEFGEGVLSKPIVLDTFANTCDKVLAETDLQHLKDKNILLAGE